MNAIIEWFTHTLSTFVSKEGIVFIISMFPILELRGGILAGTIMNVEAYKAIPIAIIGNMVPIPFVLLFIKRIFAFLKRYSWAKKWIDKLEKRAMSKSESITRYELLGLLLFVGVPLPGTGAWTGALIASLLEMDTKKSSISIFLGVVLAAGIMTILSYGILGQFLR